jgi:acetylglutamate kinase
MIPKVDACTRALGAASAAHIVDGRVPHVLLEALCRPDTIGTTITRNTQ